VAEVGPLSICIWEVIISAAARKPSIVIEVLSCFYPSPSRIPVW